MNPEMVIRATEAALIFTALYVAHQVADHWVQTDHQARTKGEPDTLGRLACAMHVATYTLTTIVFVVAVWMLFGLPISPYGFLAGQALSAVTHYWADRRTTLRWLAEHTGKARFWLLGAPREITAYTELLTIDGEDLELEVHPVRAPGVPRSGERPLTWDNPSLGTGAYALDQSWHVFWLFVAALATALL